MDRLPAAMKRDLRSKLKKERQKLTTDEVNEKSRLILERLTGYVDWRHVKAAHCYKPIGKLNEVDTGPLFKFFWQKWPAIATYTSQKIDNDWVVGQLKPDGSFEPQPQELPMFDLIVVPMLGFAVIGSPKCRTELNRLGYGGGYYDRFLATQPQAQKIGLCYEAGKMLNIPVEPHDVPIGVIITELQNYTP